MKIGVLIPDWFWSAIPYEGLSLFYYLKDRFDVDLLMFNADIRLNKRFKGEEKFYFNREEFANIPNLIQMKDWEDFVKLTESYKLIVSGVHLAPKNRGPETFLNISKLSDVLKCPLMMTDIGGCDILVSKNRATYFCVKGPVWKEWMVKNGANHKNVFVTGCPQYDYYHEKNIYPVASRPINKNKFYQKYDLDQSKKLILVAPTNPASHREQMDENLGSLLGLSKMAADFGHQVIVKTYPHDYVFNEIQENYSGIYKRIYNNEEPQWTTIKKYCPLVKIIDSQDHFSAMLASDKVLNISGSHIAWETVFTGGTCYTKNYADKSYYIRPSYLPDYVHLPDDIININLRVVENMFNMASVDKKAMAPYILKEYSLPNIAIAIKEII